jgi:hypothetical protein
MYGMKTITSQESKPVVLQDLLDSYNGGKINVEDFTKKMIPLLALHRQEAISCFVIKLIADNPERYHVSSPYHARLWEEAEAAYDADSHARLAAQPGVLEKLEETYRRVEAKLRQSEEQSISV